MLLPPAVFEVSDAAVRFGEVRALDGVSLAILPGECIGLVGHNGAGKSTIVSVINGGLTPQQGEIFSDGTRLAPYGIGVARNRGVRCVFQELSLCPNLSIIENTRIMHRTLGGFGWRARARAIIAASLDAVFPGHGIDVGDQVGVLSIAQRQMVEIAMAFSDAGQPPRLVILDEPTSSLDAGLATQLLAHVRRFVAAGGAVILISHMLNEILETASRIVVMKDGKIVAERAAGGFDHAGLVKAMGSVATHQATARRSTGASQSVLDLPMAKGQPFRACKGEVVGLAGLGGHGQTRMLLALFDHHAPQWWPRRDPAVTFVAGDRRENGIFDRWSILKNMTIATLSDLSRRGLLQDGAETARGATWKTRIEIRTANMENPILSLSGGNQQKVLFARALSTRAPVVLMDDPMRGVDVGTKQEVYGIIRTEAEAGRTFVWYSTEMEEMQLCDRVYVFREGVIVAELTGDAISEHNILAASFEGTAA
ncbi:ATP-binding cassette domain-containing protein [Pseudotabrizicola alkalilacus]|uniref:Sugar ABC transporter ATP-binding protein n=1 Tax=Pseudotabrizicola alkalilacus TaxID=2305252 RepID=A0A411Z367_9RHOB|nr:sugar ABC transporter ATP-binding protein [Pseudotabrizicola alkalilacus]RGP37504.1 sugar ABC transporter ATP-binding protein [Pseudotabrizicola alkalilacus]